MGRFWGKSRSLGLDIQGAEELWDLPVGAQDSQGAGKEETGCGEPVGGGG